MVSASVVAQKGYTLYYGCIKRVFFLTTDDKLKSVFPTISLQLVTCVRPNGETMHQVLHPSKQDQLAVIQFLGAEGCQPVEIYHRMQAVYGSARVSKTTANDWSRQFRQGRQSTDDLTRPGRSRVATTPVVLRRNRRL